MSAIVVCGNKRSFFEDLPANSPSSSSSSSSSITKRLRCSTRFPTTSADCFNPFGSSVAFATLDHLRNIFPAMDNQLLEKTLEECGNDLDSAIKRLTELRLGSSTDGTLDVESDKAEQSLQTGVTPSEEGNASAPDNNLPKDGPEWVELLVTEMANSSNMDDAKARASRVLELLETSIRSRADAEAAQNFQMENMMLKEQIETLIRGNTILKRAVTIQHERQKEYDERSQELQHLKQLVSQYQEQLRTLEFQKLSGICKNKQYLVETITINQMCGKPLSALGQKSLNEI